MQPTPAATTPAPAGTTATTPAATTATPPPTTGAPAAGTPPTTGGSPENATGVRAAQQHLARATQFFRNRQYEEAIHEFELANAAAPSADFWFNIARAYELLNRYDESVDYYRRYLRDKVDPPDRADVEHRITELARLAEQARRNRRAAVTQGTLRFDVNPPGASISLAGRPVGRAPMVESLTVPPGTHELRVTAAGMQEWRSSVRVRAGDSVTAFATLAPSTQYRTRSGGHILSFILGGIGIASLGTGVGFGISAATQDPCIQGVADCSRRNTAVIADVFFGAAATLAVSAVIAYFVEAGSSRTVRVAAPPAR